MAAGSPFQLEVAFSNLALGILGVLASADGHAEEPATLGPWHDTVVTAAAHATAVVAATLSLGYAVNQSAIGAAVGSLLAAAAITHTVSRAARRHG